MKKKTFTILFFVKRTKLLKNGDAPIFTRITVDGIRLEMSIQRSIKLPDWVEKKGCAKGIKRDFRLLENITYTAILFHLQQVILC